MKYVFEDSRSDALSKIFESAYFAETTSNFIYCNGNGNIAKELAKIDPEEDVVVFLDVVPDNKDTARLYRNLTEFKKRFKRFIIFPIPCREYYYIKSMSGTQAVIDTYRNSITRCLNMDYYTDDTIIETETDRKHIKNFEKFCKVVAIKAFIDCAKLTGSTIRYFEHDCMCNSPIDKCKKVESIENKLFRLLSAYMCVPSGSRIGKKESITWDDCIKINNLLVDMYMAAYNKFKAHGADCKRIFYMS